MLDTGSTATQIMVVVGLVAAAYLIGGIPVALIVGKKVGGVDLRTVGSGNLGATNVSRVLGGKWAVTVFALDFFKGAISVAVASILMPGAWDEIATMATTAGAVLGHVYSPYIRFKGGKGIAVLAGCAAVLNPWSLLWGTIAFFAVAVSSRRVSLGSLVIGLSYPITVLIYYPGRLLNLAFAVGVCAFIWWSHRSNIRRLLAGQEPKVSWGIFRDRD